MAIPLFNGQAIFGAQTKETTGDQAFREQRETLPGADGVRIYRLGAGTRTWTVRGRLSYTTRGALESAINAALAYRNGQLYTYTSAAGNAYANCLLTNFQQIGQVQRIVAANNAAAYTVEVQGTVECTTPS